MSDQPLTLEDTSLLVQLDDQMAAVNARARQSLVQITSGTGWHKGSGAGTIWHSDGLIVTNAHVIARGRVQVTLPDGQVLPARVLAADEDLDLAALQVEASDLPPINLGNSKSLRPGQWVTAVGHPWGVLGASTSGIVIGAGREFPELVAQGREWIAVSLHMRPGHSGGPLLDAEGNVVGINTMITGPDVGFAIPVDVIKAFLKAALGRDEEPIHESSHTHREGLI